MREMTWLVVVVFCLSQQVLGLTLTQLKVPPFGLGGQSARLVCEYDSQGEQVYSVKWYKGGLEIFRFLPSSAPPLSVFPRPGVNILQSQSNATVLQLTNLTVATTGRYRCEVSTEAPVFRTESKYGDLLVIVLPSAPPQISGENRTSLAQLAPGDLLLLSCRSDQSKPAADLGWTINGHKVPGENVEQEPIFEDERTGLYSSESSLNITLTEEHFTEDGKIEISCTASIGSLSSRARTGSRVDEEDVL